MERFVDGLNWNNPGGCMQFDLGNIITIAVIIVTAVLNFMRSKTKVETKLDFLAEQVQKQNGRISKLEDHNLQHLEVHHGRKN